VRRNPRRRIRHDVTISTQKKLAGGFELLTWCLAAIPVVDVREGGTLRHAREDLANAHALHDTIIEWFPPFIRPLIPIFDGVARGWLVRSRSPYVDEVNAIADLLGVHGLWFLNGSYQWCCTALAREEDDVPWLARTLDWEFPGLGRFVAIAQMNGQAGEYYNVTWPGYVGALTALAPGRFAAAINQAPLRRRTLHPRLRLLDFATNLSTTLRHSRAVPPDQLLRRVFETARDYSDAKSMLQATPVARPVIYTLVGCRAGERCTIERTEDSQRTRYDDQGAANDWLDSLPHWEGRMDASRVLTGTFEEAAEDSRVRRQGLALWQGSFARDSFAWVVPPVLNGCTRIAVELCPARGILRAVGYERAVGRKVAEPATLPCHVTVNPRRTGTTL
jgi:hypothetical protein